MTDKIAVLMTCRRARGRTDSWDADNMWNSMQFYERETILAYMKYTHGQIESMIKLPYTMLPSCTCSDLDELFHRASKGLL